MKKYFKKLYNTSNFVVKLRMIFRVLCNKKGIVLVEMKTSNARSQIVHIKLYKVNQTMQEAQQQLLGASKFIDYDLRGKEKVTATLN